MNIFLTNEDLMAVKDLIVIINIVNMMMIMMI
jgi:hypothetical protein